MIVFFLRATVLPWYLPFLGKALLIANVLIPLAAAGLIIGCGGWWRWAWGVFLLASAASLIQADDLDTAISRWIGLALLMVAVGPVILNPVAMELRAAAWKLTISGLPILGGIFVVWYLLRLPNFGAGFFSTFLGHCMLLGPFAGLAVGIALTRATHDHSLRWAMLGLLGVIPVLASGSRVATLATGLAASYPLLRRKPIIGLVCAVLLLLVGYRFIGAERSERIGDSLAGALAYKGTENTRAELWQARISEFKSSPIIGIGIAMGTGSGSLKNEQGDIRVEPGSSYLAILAMTGGAGTATFVGGVGMLVFGFLTTKKRTGVDRDLLSVVGIFLAVHGIAEGWVLSFGSPLCFIFWLWLGNFGDAAHQPARATARRKVGVRWRSRRRPISFGPSVTVPRPLTVGRI